MTTKRRVTALRAARNEISQTIAKFEARSNRIDKLGLGDEIGDQYDAVLEALESALTVVEENIAEAFEHEE